MTVKESNQEQENEKISFEDYLYQQYLDSYYKSLHDLKSVIGSKRLESIIAITLGADHAKNTSTSILDQSTLIKDIKSKLIKYKKNSTATSGIE